MRWKYFSRSLRNAKAFVRAQYDCSSLSRQEMHWAALRLTSKTSRAVLCVHSFGGELGVEYLIGRRIRNEEEKMSHDGDSSG